MPLGRVWKTLAISGWVALAMATALAARGIIGERTLLAAILIFLIASALLLRSALSRLPALRRAIDAMIRAPDAPIPDLGDGDPALLEWWHGVTRTTREWRDRIVMLEDELREARHALTCLPDPLLIVNSRREIVEANAAATALFGHRIVERDLAVALRTPAILDAVNAVLRGASGRTVEFDMAVPVALQMKAQVRSLRRDDTGAGGGALIVLHDQTAAKRAEQMRVDFVANASHELRTPLTALIGFIETLRGPAADDTEAQQRFLGIMDQQAQRMIRLVEDLLSLSHIELNEHLPPTGAVAIESLLFHLRQALELKAAERGVTIELQLPAICPVILGDADELTQVFQNLIDNAVKYGRPNTPVTVTLEPSARLRQGVALAVRDQGEGIPRMHLPRLTERFYRVDAARSRQLGGTGLGLAIVKHIVSRHRGIFEVDSVLGEGSVFTVHLPIQAMPDTGETKSAANAP